MTPSLILLRVRWVKSQIPDATQPLTARHWPEPDRRRLRNTPRPLVEPSGGRPGLRPRPPHGADASSYDLPNGGKRSDEARIVSLHAKKRELADSLLADGDAGARVGADELLALLKEERGLV